MKKTDNLRSAFSMLELIFVIVILGIVASIGSEIIANVYESYIVQRAQYRANIKTELAINQIENRLHYAIGHTVGYRVVNKTSPFFRMTGTVPPDAKVLQWVTYDGESFEAASTPGWSGFCDLDSSTSGVMVTPGSGLNLSNTISGNLGRGSLTAAVYFPDGSEHNVSSVSGENVTLASSLIGDMWEQYKLARTSYAIVDEGDDLVLYYNFSPTFGAPIGGSSSVLLEGVSNFRFTASEGSIWIKICKEENIGEGNTTADTVRSCKEKVVF